MADEVKVDEITRKVSRITPEIEIIPTIFRPVPFGDISGRKIFVSTTAKGGALPKIKRSLENNHDCEVVKVSNSLGDLSKLREELENNLGECDVLLTELKAGAITVGAKMAKENDIDLKFLHNEIIPVGKTPKSFAPTIISLCRDIEENRE